MKNYLYRQCLPRKQPGVILTSSRRTIETNKRPKNHKHKSNLNLQISFIFLLQVYKTWTDNSVKITYLQNQACVWGGKGQGNLDGRSVQVGGQTTLILRTWRPRAVWAEQEVTQEGKYKIAISNVTSGSISPIHLHPPRSPQKNPPTIHQKQ